MKIIHAFPLSLVIFLSLAVASCTPAAVPPPASGGASVQPVAPASTSPVSSALAPATLAPTKATPTLQANLPKSPEEIQRIQPELLLALIEGGADIAVVDVQPGGLYKREHLPGAMSSPRQEQIRSPGNLPIDKLVVLYCACDHEEDSLDVAMQLVTHFGFTKVAVLEGGWNRWLQLGYPTEKGK